MRNSSRLERSAWAWVVACLFLAAVLPHVPHSGQRVEASSIQGSQPIVCGSRALTGQTGSIATTTVCTAPVKGLYRISYYFVITTAAAAGTIILNENWTDAVGARTVASATVSLTTTGFSNSALARPGMIAFQAEAGSLITFDVALAAVVGSPVYDVYVTAELLR